MKYATLKFNPAKHWQLISYVLTSFAANKEAKGKYMEI